MARPKKKLKLVNLTFRVDPLLMDTFHTHCNQIHTTRSEAFRAIFNKHINTLKQQQNETNDIERI